MWLHSNPYHMLRIKQSNDFLKKIVLMSQSILKNAAGKNTTKTGKFGIHYCKLILSINNFNMTFYSC